MKKIGIGIIVLVLCGIIVSGFIYVPIQKYYPVHKSFFNAVNDFYNPAGWNKWYKGTIQNNTLTKNGSFSIKTKDGAIEIKNSGGYSFTITENKGQQKQYYNCVFQPTFKNDSCGMFVVYKKSLLKTVFPFLSGSSSFENQIVQFKEYMENDLLYYGYSINLGQVEDSSVLFIQKKMPLNNYLQTLSIFHSELDSFAHANKRKILQPPIVHFSVLPKDSIGIMVGVAVDNNTAPENSGIQKADMPTKGRMLTGQFKGKFAERNLLYKAMDNYMRDYHLRQVAFEFEKYMDNKFPSDDSSEVNIKLYFPVY
jgi:effector-binding domain-containing protein